MVSKYFQFSTQLLSCSVHISHQDSSLASKLEYMHCGAFQPFRVRKEMHYRVEGHGPYKIYEEGDWVGEYPWLDDVLYIIYRRVYLRLTERYMESGWVGFHGGLANINGQRLALLGDKGAGKTTLSTALLQAGYTVEADEVFLSRTGQAVALPRRFHVKPGTEKQLPTLGDCWGALPLLMNEDLPVRALDPSLLGLKWELQVGSVDTIVWITPNHGGDSQLNREGSFETLQRLIASVRYWGGSRAQVIAEASLLARCGGAELVLGTLDDSIGLLQTMTSTNAFTMHT